MGASIFILLGSNMDDRHSNLNYGRQEISRSIGEIVTASSIYKTAAWGKVDQPDFYNQVIKILSTFSPEEALVHILAIEEKAGRIRKEKWEPRVLDIDILFFGDLIRSSANLTIPHPEIPNRKFTLLPLAEIAPDLLHPVYHKTIDQLLIECTDDLAVAKL